MVLNDPKAFAQQAKALHGMAAVLMREPVLELRDEEADRLSCAVCRVLDKHGIDLEATSGPIMYVELAAAVAAVYLPRVMVLAARRRANAAPAKAPMGDLVGGLPIINPGAAPQGGYSTN